MGNGRGAEARAASRGRRPVAWRGPTLALVVDGAHEDAVVSVDNVPLELVGEDSLEGAAAELLGDLLDEAGHVGVLGTGLHDADDGVGGSAAGGNGVCAGPGPESVSEEAGSVGGSQSERAIPT